MMALLMTLLNNPYSIGAVISLIIGLWIHARMRKAKRDAVNAAVTRERHEANNAALKKKKKADDIASKAPGKKRTRRRLRDGKF